MASSRKHCRMCVHALCLVSAALMLTGINKCKPLPYFESSDKTLEKVTDKVFLQTFSFRTQWFSYEV